MVEKRKSRPRRGPCIKCEVRLARYAEGTCEGCHHLIHAEGTKPEGLQESFRERSLRIRKGRVKEYNKLIRKGFTVVAIARQWNMSPDFVSHYMTKSRRLGLPALYADRSVASAAPRKTRSKKSAHGQGWGVKDCKCEPCLTALRQKRGDYQRAYRAEKKRLRAEQQQG